MIKYNMAVFQASGKLTMGPYGWQPYDKLQTKTLRGWFPKQAWIMMNAEWVVGLI